jgi:hypothetical protein
MTIIRRVFLLLDPQVNTLSEPVSTVLTNTVDTALFVKPFAVSNRRSVATIGDFAETIRRPAEGIAHIRNTSLRQ